MAKYRLKAGSHAVGSGEGAQRYNAKKNNVVESEQNLAAMMPEKFERLPDDFGSAQFAAPGGQSASAVSEEDEELEGLTVDELKELAKSEGVEIHSTMRRAEILKAIKKGREEA